LGRHEHGPNKHGSACPMLVPGTARPPCPCWTEIPTRQPDTGPPAPTAGTALGTMVVGSRPPLFVTVGFRPPLPSYIKASAGQAQSSDPNPSSFACPLVSLLSRGGCSCSPVFASLHCPPPPAPLWIGILNHSFSLLVGDVASSSPPFPHPPRLYLVDVLARIQI
jgi:hypothetical protein